MTGFNENKINSQERFKQESFFIEIEGRKIELAKSEFIYPEKIQAETCIEGYTKYKIPKTIFENIEQEFQVKQKKQKYLEANKGTDYSLIKILDKERMDAWQKSRIFQQKIANDICAALSNGEFPLKTYNHRIQGDDGSSGFQQELYQDKFILGEITSIAGDWGSLKHRDAGMISAIVDTDGNIVRMGDIMHSKKENIYKFGEFKGTKNDVEDRNWIRLPKRARDDMSENEFNILTKDRIVVSTMSGLYLRHKGVWGGVLNDSPSFGFSVNEEPFKSYLNKVSEIYSKISEDIFSEKNIKSLESLLNDKGNISTTSVPEIILPIMTGNTGLPPLRWGHAKYAVVPTERYLNFLVMHHTKPKTE